MIGERGFMSGLLSKDTTFRLVVTGDVGAKEIGRLIKNLEFIRDILADVEVEPKIDDL